MKAAAPVSINFTEGIVLHGRIVFHAGGVVFPWGRNICDTLAGGRYAADLTENIAL